MKLVWCPETASKAYVDAVKVLACHVDVTGLSDVAELVSAMAGGWNAQLVVEAPCASSQCQQATTTLALAAATRHTGGRYVCVLPDGDSGASYASVAVGLSTGATEGAGQSAVVVGEAEEVMKDLKGVDLLVVDARRRDVAAVLRAAKPGARGMVVVRHGCGRRRAATALAALMAAGTRVVRSVYLPIGKGVEVVHVGVGKGPSVARIGERNSRWIRHVDHDTGEEHVFRRQ